MITWRELLNGVCLMKWTTIIDFKRHKDLLVEIMDPVTAIQTDLSKNLYEHIVIINM